MDGEEEMNEMRKSSSIGALLGGARQNLPERNQESARNEMQPPGDTKQRPKSSLIQDLENMEQGFDFSSMGTMGDFSAWGFGGEDKKQEEDNSGGSGWGGGGRGGRQGQRDGGGRGGMEGKDNDWGGRDQGRRGGGFDGGRRGGRGGGGRDGGGRRDSYNSNEDGGSGWNRSRSNERDSSGGRDRSSTVQKRPGDWSCEKCGFENFASRSSCFSCNTSKGGGGGGGSQRSSFGNWGRNTDAMTGANAAPLIGKRSFAKQEPEEEEEEEEEEESAPEPEKRSRLDPDVYGPPAITSWADIKEYDDDHDAQKFAEENAYLAERYGEGEVRVRYANNGVVGYYCLICDIQLTGEKPLELHCNGAKHKKRKEKKDNPEAFEANQRNKKGSGGDRQKRGDADDVNSRPRLLPPEAFGRSSGNDQSNRDNRDRRDDNSFGGRGNNSGNRGDSRGDNRGRGDDFHGGNRGGNRGRRDSYGGGGDRRRGDSYGNDRNDRERGGGNRARGGRDNRQQGNWRDRDNQRGGAFDGGSSSDGGMFGGSGVGSTGLVGGPTGSLLTQLAECAVKSEGDADLATNVIGLLLKSLKDYSIRNGEVKIAELLLQAELKMSTIKALKVGLQYLSSESTQSFGSQQSVRNFGPPYGGGMMGDSIGGSSLMGDRPMDFGTMRNRSRGGGSNRRSGMGRGMTL